MKATHVALISTTTTLLGVDMNIIKNIFAAASFVIALTLSAGVMAAPPDIITLQTPFGQSNVLTWSWGATLAISNTGGGGGAGKSSFKDMTFTRYTDSQSPKLLGAVVTGQVLPSVIIQTGTMVFTLTNAFVTSYSVGGTAADRRPNMETVTLQFQTFQYTVDGVTQIINATP
jgi:type VI secretion system secreted protein Hcp